MTGRRAGPYASPVAQSQKKTGARVTVRFANGAAMAKKKGGGKKRGASKRKNPSKKGTRRRRNPRGGFGDRAMSLAGGALAGLAAGALVLVGMSKFQPGQPISTYGVPAVGLLAGAGIAKSHPILGAGIAIGSVAAPFALPVTSKILAATTPSTTTTTTTTPTQTAAGIASALRRGLPMGAVYSPMGAVHLGAVHPAYRTA